MHHISKLAVALSLAVLAGCSAAPATRVLWPPLPETPRMEFKGVISSNWDFVDTSFEKFLAAVIGMPEREGLTTPFDVVVRPNGLVYISDLHLKNVRIFDLERETIHSISKESIFATPAGMALDSRGNLYVADSTLGRVVVFSPTDELIGSFGTPAELTKPSYLAVDERLGRIYVTDGKAGRVVVYDLGWKHLFSFGEKQLFGPQGIALDADGKIYVADMFNARIVIFDNKGTLLETFGERGDAAGQFENPKDLAISPDGDLIVVDSRKPALLIFDKTGQLLLNLSSARNVRNILALSSPSGVFVTPDARIYIADRLMRFVAVWQYITPEYLAAHPISDAEKANATRLADEYKRRMESGAAGGDAKGAGK